MAEQYVIEVKLDPKSAVANARVVDQSLERVENRAERVGTTLKRVFAGVSAALAIRQVGLYADEFTDLQNRLRVVTDSQDELARSTRALFQIANETRAAVRGTVELYTRLALATKELDISQRELLEITKGINQAIELSGASAVEASAGLIQLSQGLASGALRGDELRSVLEQLPAVADLIATSLGVTRGQLRALGADGKITTEVIIKAVRDAVPALEEQFQRTIPTLRKSFTTLRNSIVETTGTLDSSTQVTRTLSAAVSGLANNLDLVASAVAVGGVALLSRQLVPVTTEFLKTNAATLRTAGIFGLVGRAGRGLVGALGGVPGLLLTLGTAAATSAPLIRRLTDELSGLSDEDKRLRDLGQGLAAQIDRIAELRRTFTATGRSDLAQDAANEIVASLRKVEDELEQLDKAGKDVGRELLGALAQAGVEGGDLAEAAVGDIVERLGKDPEKVARALTEIFDLRKLTRLFGIEEVVGTIAKRFQSEMDRVGGDIQQVVVENIVPDADLVRVSAGVALDALQKELKDFQPTNVVESLSKQVGTLGDIDFKFLTEALENETELLRLREREREVAEDLLDIEEDLRKDKKGDLGESQKAQLKARLELNQALQDQADLLEEIKGPLDEYNRQIEAARVLLDTGRITAEEHASAIQEITDAYKGFGDTDLSKGLQQSLEDARDALRELRGESTELDRVLSDLGPDGLKGLEALLKTEDAAQIGPVIAQIQELVRLRQEAAQTPQAPDILSGSTRAAEQALQTLREISLESDAVTRSLAEIGLPQGLAAEIAAMPDGLRHFANFSDEAKASIERFARQSGQSVDETTKRLGALATAFEAVRDAQGGALLRDIDRQIDLLGKTNAERRTAIELTRLGIDAESDLGREIARSMEKLDLAERIEDASARSANAIGDFLRSARTDFQNLSELGTNALDAIADSLFDAFLVKPLEREIQAGLESVLADITGVKGAAKPEDEIRRAAEQARRALEEAGLVVADHMSTGATTAGNTLISAAERMKAIIESARVPTPSVGGVQPGGGDAPLVVPGDGTAPVVPGEGETPISEEAQEAGDAIGAAGASAADSLIRGGDAVEAGLAAVSASVLGALAETAGDALGGFLQGLGSSAAARGRIFPFAEGGMPGLARAIPGGIVDKPTLFPLGLAGEAGPEAIIPLTRDRRLPIAGTDVTLGLTREGGMLRATIGQDEIEDLIGRRFEFGGVRGPANARDLTFSSSGSGSDRSQARGARDGPVAFNSTPSPVNVSVVNVTDHREIVAAMASDPEFDKIILNVMRRNPLALRRAQF